MAKKKLTKEQIKAIAADLTDGYCLSAISAGWDVDTVAKDWLLEEYGAVDFVDVAIALGWEASEAFQQWVKDTQ